MSQTRLKELAKDLALAVDPQLEFDKVWLESTRNWVLEELRKDTHGGHQREWHDVKRSLLGLSEKARLRVQDPLADGLVKMVGQMESHQQRGAGDWNDDLPLKTRNLAQHVQLLLNLATPATSQAHAAAYDLLHRKAPTGPTPDELLYEEIMRERFTGEHWGQGYNEEVKHGWTDSEGEDEATSSDEEIITPHSKKGGPSYSVQEMERLRQREEAEARMHEARQILQRMERGMYWKHAKILEDGVPEGLNGWKAVSTEISALALAGQLVTSSSRTSVVTSMQLQRELLFALSGRPGVFFENVQQGTTISLRLRTERPQVRHLSSETLTGILQQVENRAEHLYRIRAFTASHLRSRTAEAFAECCRAIISDVGRWVGDIEQTLTMGLPSSSSQIASTPLQLLRDFDNAHGELLDHLVSFLNWVDQPVVLLNAVASALGTASTDTATSLQTMLVRSAEPSWSMLQNWLVEVMPVPAFLLDTESGSEGERAMPEEFFIHRDHDVEWGDEDFWESAYVESEEGWPIWLGNADLKESIIEAGKARGLLKALGEKPSLPVAWTKLDTLVRQSRPSEADGTTGILESISQAISAHVSPICALTTFQLRRVLDEDCGLLSHLDAIEGVLYMRHFPVIADWSQWLFKQMSDGSRWSDFHLPTGNLRDCIEQNQAEWLNAPAIRITVARSPRKKAPELGSIRASYQVPFPLSQIFSPTSMELRSEVFTFLLRLLCARSSLRRGFKELSTLNACDASTEDKAERTLRHRLAWLLETVWGWLNNLIDIEVERYRSQLAATTSVKAMIALELAHTRRIRDFCFLHDHAANAREAINGTLHLVERITTSGESDLRFDNLLKWNAQFICNASSLRDDIEELVGAGEPGSKGAEVRQGWSSLSVALQDWR